MDLYMGRRLIVAIAEEAAREGRIPVSSDISDTELRDHVMTQIATALTETTDWTATVIHGQTMEEEAQRFADAGQLELAILLYATCVEHALNSALRTGGEHRRGLTDIATRSMLREAPLRAKTGWLWQLLFDTTFDPAMAALVDQIATRRNSFVHYKWVGVALDDPSWDQVQEAELVRAAPALLAAIKASEEQIVFNGRWPVIERAALDWADESERQRQAAGDGSD